MLLKLKEDKPNLTTLCGLKLDQSEADFCGWGLTPQDAKLLAPEVLVLASLTSVNVLSNKLDMESASMLLKVKAEKPNLRTLCELTHEETKLDLSAVGLGPGDALLLAPEISVIASLTSIDLSRNVLCGVSIDGRGDPSGTFTAEGITALADALRVCASLTWLDVSLNSLGQEGEAVLRNAVEGRSGFELLL